VQTQSPPVEETWRLEDLFADGEVFASARRELRDRDLPPLEAFRGRLLESASVLAEALEAIDAALERLHLLYSYASMKSDADMRVAANQALRQEIQLLATDFSKRTSWVRPEILAGDPATIEAFLAVEPRLAPHAHPLRDLIRQREHVLGAEEEKIVAEAGLLTSEPRSLHGILTDAEMPRPEFVLASGETVRLTSAAFQKHRATCSREERLAMFPCYFGAYASFKDTLGQNLFAGVKTHVFRARVRRYASCLAAALEPDHVPESVYRNLIARVRENLPTFHRYCRLRARFLGLPRLQYPDLYGPLTGEPPLRYPVADARRLVLDGTAPLGQEYGSALAAAFDSRWIDWRPTDGKRSGAYASGLAYRVHPYVLLNFNEDYDGLTTLAHEMGHAMHSHFSNRAQPFPTADYSIFVAEVASTFNEALLLDHMLERAKTDGERLFLLASYLDGIRGTLFRQAMFAEFELAIHESVERGEVLTGEKLGESYLRLLREVHGHDAGVVEVGEEYAVEWAAIPHMYYDFYVYQYATGIVAATALARAVLDGRTGARDRYLAFLRSGGSDYPLELLRAAGVDLQRSEAYDQAFRTIDRRLDQLERLLPTTGPGPRPR
jgi:oligoendopeptidase F